MFKKAMFEYQFLSDYGNNHEVSHFLLGTANSFAICSLKFKIFLKVYYWFKYCLMLYDFAFVQA